MPQPKTPTRPRTLSIGGATYDLFVRTNRALLQFEGNGAAIHLPIGSKIRVEQVIETCGGGASNTSVGLRRLGCNAGFLGVVGSDQWGERLLKNFEEEGVDTSCATVVEGETSSFSIILSVGSGERIILYEPGTNSHLADATFDRSAAASVEWIYLNHIDEKSCMIEDDLVGILEESGDPGLTWNPGGCHLESGMQEKINLRILANTDFLVLNKEEALQFTKAETVADAFEAFADAGAKIACITDGKRGSMAHDGRQLVHCGILDAPVIDTTGAGDAFGAGATWAMLAGLDLPETLRAGTMNATSVLGVIGAEPGLLTDTEMRSRLASIPLECEVTSLDRCPW